MKNKSPLMFGHKQDMNPGVRRKSPVCNPSNHPPTQAELPFYTIAQEGCFNKRPGRGNYRVKLRKMGSVDSPIFPVLIHILIMSQSNRSVSPYCCFHWLLQSSHDRMFGCSHFSVMTFLLVGEII